MFTLYNLSLRQMKTTSFSRKYSPFVNILFSYIAYFMRILVILVENTFQYLSQILVWYSAYFLRILVNICWEYFPIFVSAGIFCFDTFHISLKLFPIFSPFSHSHQHLRLRKAIKFHGRHVFTTPQRKQSLNVGFVSE